MGRCVERLPHECGSRKGLQVFLKEDGKYDGYCYSCDTYVADPYKDKPDGYKPTAKVKPKEEIQQEMDDVKSCPYLDAEERGLDKETLKYFGIRTGLSEKDGSTPNIRYFPITSDGKLLTYKCKLISVKKMWIIPVGNIKEADLFGWERAKRTGQKRLYITEGEEDAAALFKILKMGSKVEYRDRNHAVTSLPFGVSSAPEVVARAAEKAKKEGFKEIVLVFDQDEPGRKAVEEVCRLVPNVMSATLPLKDANECLKHGYIKDTYNKVVFQSSAPKNSRLVWGHEIHEEAKKKAEWGLSWPWDGMTEITRGIRFGETYYIAAGEKMGGHCFGPCKTV